MLHNAAESLTNLKVWFHQLQQLLNGWPDYLLSLSMIITGCVAILVGMFGPRWLKLLMLAWMWFP